jgi:hypothetical protein
MSQPALAVTDAFTASLAAINQYPKNLVDRHTYSATLRAYHKRLEQAADRLFESDESRIEVAFRDFDETTTSQWISEQITRED